MLIKFGSIVTAGRGKLGGHVYSRNRAGAYVRTNITPSNPQTSFQQAGRAILTQLSQAWSALSASQIKAWNAAVGSFERTNVFGDSKKLSGKNLFVSLNKNLNQVGATTLDDPPLPTALVVPTDLTIDQPAAGKFDITPELSADVNHLVVEATPGLSPGQSFVKNSLRVLMTTPATKATAIDIDAEYTARYGTPQSGARISIGVYTVNDSGQRSPHFVSSIVIA